MRSKKTKESFVKFLKENPQLRFWQALRAWSEVGFILTSTHFDPDMFDRKWLSKNRVDIQDTFYLE